MIHRYSSVFSLASLSLSVVLPTVVLSVPLLTVSDPASVIASDVSSASSSEGSSSSTQPCAPLMTIATLADIDVFAANIAAGMYTQEEIDCIVDATDTQPLVSEMQAVAAELDVQISSLPSQGDGMAYEQIESALYEILASQLETYGGMDAETCDADPACAFLMADDSAELRAAISGQYDKAFDAIEGVIKVHNESIEFHTWGKGKVDAAVPAGVVGKDLLKLLALKAEQARLMKQLQTSMTASHAKGNVAIGKVNAVHAKVVEADALTGEARKAKLMEAAVLVKEAAAAVADAKIETDQQLEIRRLFNTIPPIVIP